MHKKCWTSRSYSHIFSPNTGNILACLLLCLWPHGHCVQCFLLGFDILFGVDLVDGTVEESRLSGQVQWSVEPGSVCYQFSFQQSQQQLVVCKKTKNRTTIIEFKFTNTLWSISLSSQKRGLPGLVWVCPKIWYPSCNYGTKRWSPRWAPVRSQLSSEHLV